MTSYGSFKNSQGSHSVVVLPVIDQHCSYTRDEEKRYAL